MLTGLIWTYVIHRTEGSRVVFLSARLLEPIIEFNYRVFLKVKACALSGIMQLSSYPNDGDLFSADAKKSFG